MKNLKINNLFNTKVKTKALPILLVILLSSAFVGTLFVGEASALIAYTEYEGTLPGGDWLLRMPDPWNGMLVVLCRGLSFNPVNPVSTVSGMGRSMLDAGFAVAASNYGVTGFAVTEGVESSYELTMYIMENYGVTGKVFLYGLSMGGGIALLLAEKYPDVYSGVLDAYGIKDIKALQTYSVGCSQMNDEELEAEFRRWGITQIPPDWFSSLQAARDFFTNAANSTELALGGTPKSNPQAYEDVSPTYHANIQIPVITVHGTDDSLVPYYQSIMYQDAVADAGRSSLHRLYSVPGAGHGWLFPTTEIPSRFNELVEWSNELTDAHDWPMYGYDAQRSGYTTSSAPNTNFTLWISQLDGGTGGAPSVVDGRLYANSWSGMLQCFDAATGDSIWNFTTGGPVVTNPCVTGGRVYFGSNDYNVYCLDALTGAKIWSYKTGDIVYGGITVVDGRVYAGSEDDKLYCLRADYGQVEWKFKTGGDVHFASVADGKVYVSSLDGTVYCLDAASSDLIWSYRTGGEIGTAIAVANSKVYFDAQDDYVTCLDAMTGTKIWSYETGSGTYSSPVVADGKLYVGSNSGNVYCLDPETGELIWNYAAAGAVYGSPAVADGKVYVGSSSRRVYCLDAATGALIWSYLTNGMMFGSPVVANGVAYVMNFNGQVIAFSAWEPIPEGLTIGVMLILSTIAVAVSARYFNKRRKWENW